MRPGWNWLKTHPERPEFQEVAAASAERFRKPTRKEIEAARVTRDVKRSLKRAARGE